MRLHYLGVKLELFSPRVEPQTMLSGEMTIGLSTASKVGWMPPASVKRIREQGCTAMNESRM